MKRFGIMIAMVLMLPSLTACGGQSKRSVSVYCDTVAKYKDRYLSAMAEANSTDGLAGLLRGAGAIGDLNNMWTELADVAPDEIKSDTEVVQKAWSKAEEAGLKGDFLGALANAIDSSGPTERVNTYIAEKCGPEYAPAGTGDTHSQGVAGRAPLPAGSITPRMLGLSTKMRSVGHARSGISIH